LQKDGLVSLQPSFIKVQPAGRLLIRNICMVFDRYLRGKSGQRFSKVI
jgi:oxygen-independent coproporphyrinogen-3 oxidase